MGARLRAVEAVVELLSGLALVGVARRFDGEIPVAYLTVGFASGFLYRQAQTTVAGGGFRVSPLRNAALVLAWTPLAVAIDRSAGGRLRRRAFAAGITFGSTAHWLTHRD